MSRFLLDTNVLSEPLKLKPLPIVIEKLQRYEGEVAIAAVTWYEMLFGCYCLPVSRKRQRIEQYLTQIVRPNMPILPYDTESANWHALQYSRLVAIGRTPAFTDSQIAVIAQVNGLTLVTNNTSDFADFEDLDVENWFTT